MSYCVNCGVKVNETEPYCPLCECPVVNPVKTEELPENKERPYAKRRDTIKNIMDRQFIASVISILYLLPIVICIAVDFKLKGAMTWSWISTISVILCWAVIFLPYLIEKNLTVLYLAIDLTLIISLFLAIGWYTDTSNWIWILAVPIAFTLFVMLNLMFYGIHLKTLRDLYIGAFALSAVSVLCVIIELLEWNYRVHYVSPDSRFTSWSILVFISCIIVAGLLFYIEKKKSLKRALEKRFHI